MIEPRKVTSVRAPLHTALVALLVGCGATPAPNQSASTPSVEPAPRVDEGCSLLAETERGGRVLVCRNTVARPLEGDIDVSDFLRRHARDFAECYDEQLAEDPTLGFDMPTRLSFTGATAVGFVIQGDVAERCMTARMRGWQDAPSSSGSSKPFLLRYVPPADGATRARLPPPAAPGPPPRVSVGEIEAPLTNESPDGTLAETVRASSAALQACTDAQWQRDYRFAARVGVMGTCTRGSFVVEGWRSDVISPEFQSCISEAAAQWRCSTEGAFWLVPVNLQSPR